MRALSNDWLFRAFWLAAGSLVVALSLPQVAAKGGEAPEVGPGAERPVVIAHRGASGYLPEHTLVAYAMAYAQGADYLEPDLVLTRDGVPVALHDLTLDATTDVARRFEDRARADGLHYVADFSLEEIRGLSVNERVIDERGTARYPDRFPPELLQGALRIVTLAELIELVDGLNTVTGRAVGIYPELKFAAWHAAQGLDITARVVEVLDAYGYLERGVRCILQSFESAPLRRLRDDFGVDVPLVQLLGENDWAMNDEDYDPMYTPAGLARIAAYADGIGPPITRVLGPGADGGIEVSRLVEDAHAAGLAVHPYTVRTDVLPAGLDADTLFELLFDRAGVDGVFVDQPDAAMEFLLRRQARDSASVDSASAGSRGSSGHVDASSDSNPGRANR